MAQEAGNPFVLPGLGQAGDAAGNPLFAGLDMMRQAWQNMAGVPGVSPSVATGTLPTLSLEELDKRIRELQTVHNWLQLNAGMLASTIQGLEIQRSTLHTFQSFADQALSTATGASPAAASPKARSQATAAPEADETHAADQSTAASEPDPSAAYAEAAGEWWRMVHQQFEHLAQATVASLQEVADSSEVALAPAGNARQPKARAAAAQPAAKKPTATKSTAATGRKPTAKKAAASSRKS